MHGVKRDRTQQSEAARAARKAKEAAKLTGYLELEQAFFAAKKQSTYTQETLQLSTKLLAVNPELYTAWNFRRRVLHALFAAAPASPADDAAPAAAKPDFFAAAREEAEQQSESSESTLTPEQRQLQAKRDLLNDDVELTTHALRAHPKVYWIWNHRKWCLEQLPLDEGEVLQEGVGEQKWKREMGLVEHMLQLDARNFHGWDYRRFVLTRLAPSPATLAPFPTNLAKPTLLSPATLAAQLKLAEAELAYTLRAIERNFSNFSAWHQRARVLPNVWKAKGLTREEVVKSREVEFDLVKQAMYTDPSDQSIWLYHAWLIEQAPSVDVLQREMKIIDELLELEPDSKWCMQSLATYSTLLVEQLSAESDQAQIDSLRSRAKQLLERLVEVDADRAERYRDLIRAMER